ncbi:MAG TPA: hypothetical protein VMW43_04035 [Bacteroidota bacterium]|nr:hypothetical protein [Bacteroidota bacterium]
MAKDIDSLIRMTIVLIQYIDPGSMGMLTQIIYFVLIALGAFILFFKKGSLNLLNLFRKGKKSGESPDVRNDGKKDSGTAGE